MQCFVDAKQKNSNQSLSLFFLIPPDPVWAVMSVVRACKLVEFMHCDMMYYMLVLAKQCSEGNDKQDISDGSRQDRRSQVLFTKEFVARLKTRASRRRITAAAASSCESSLATCASSVASLANSGAEAARASR